VGQRHSQGANFGSNGMLEVLVQESPAQEVLLILLVVLALPQWIMLADC